MKRIFSNDQKSNSTIATKDLRVLLRKTWYRRLLVPSAPPPSEHGECYISQLRTTRLQNFEFFPYFFFFFGIGGDENEASSSAMPIMASILVVVVICTCLYCLYCWRWRKRNGIVFFMFGTCEKYQPDRFQLQL